MWQIGQKNNDHQETNRQVIEDEDEEIMKDRREEETSDHGQELDRLENEEQSQVEDGDEKTDCNANTAEDILMKKKYFGRSETLL